MNNFAWKSVRRPQLRESCPYAVGAVYLWVVLEFIVMLKEALEDRKRENYCSRFVELRQDD